mmetsp:Transcript_39673/g.58895  ORF Transcript_39673/g.58895 Transcript_39673/m.58895 type:complete len:130 (-) Transcript_39673:360-749(-)
MCFSRELPRVARKLKGGSIQQGDLKAWVHGTVQHVAALEQSGSLGVDAAQRDEQAVKTRVLNLALEKWAMTDHPWWYRAKHYGVLLSDLLMVAGKRGRDATRQIASTDETFAISILFHVFTAVRHIMAG